MKVETIAIALTLIFSNCFAQTDSVKIDWVYLNQTKSATIYLKSEYVSKDYSGGKIWTMLEYPTKKINGKIYKNVVEKILYQINCKEKQLQVVRIVTYSSTGKVIYSTLDYYYDFMKDVIPGSVGDNIVTVSCEMFKN